MEEHEFGGKSDSRGVARHPILDQDISSSCKQVAHNNRARWRLQGTSRKKEKREVVPRGRKINRVGGGYREELAFGV